MTTKRSRRGAAAVEMAVSMIFLVPLIMYMFFLQDMLAMKLNGQEAAIQAVWDYSVLDMSGQQVSYFDGSGGSSQVGKMNRWTYCDHSSAYDSYDVQHDCNDQGHHKPMSAHECWVGTDPGKYGGQVRCSNQGEPLGTASVPAGAKGNAQGGVVECRSRLGIMNYYLPNKFLTTFRKGDGFSMNTDASGTQKQRFQSRWATGNGGGSGSTTALPGGGGQDNAHGDKDQLHPAGEESNGSNYWRLNWTYNQMLVDAWALGLEGGDQDAASIDPNSPSGPLYDRVQAAYPGAAFGAMAMAYGGQLVSDSMLNPIALLDGQGDNLMSAQAAFKAKDQPQQFNNSHWAAQGGDQRVQQTYNNRQDGYFGFNQ